MKKNLLFSSLFLLFFLTKVDGQVWFQEGDSWTYRYSYFWGEKGYEQVWVNGDTIIEGQECKILNSQIYKVFTGQNPSNDTIISTVKFDFVYEQSDSVYWYHEDEFKLIYSFTNFLTGIDPFVIREGEGHPDGDFCDYEIDFYSADTISMFISGANRRVVTYLAPEPSTFYESQSITIIEGIGIISQNNGEQKFGHIIPGKAYGCSFDSYYWRFCSFSSNGEEYNPDEEDCDQLPLPVATNNLSTTPVTYDLYPNPANTHFSVQNLFKLPIKKVTIFSAKGSVEKVIPQPPKEIAIRDLAKGIYIVEVAIGDELVYKKLVKQ